MRHRRTIEIEVTDELMTVAVHHYLTQGRLFPAPSPRLRVITHTAGAPRVQMLIRFPGDRKEELWVNIDMDPHSAQTVMNAPARYAYVVRDTEEYSVILATGNTDEEAAENADRALAERFLAEVGEQRAARMVLSYIRHMQELCPGADEPHQTPRPPGRNDPCPCGSGRKYKKCCGSVR